MLYYMYSCCIFLGGNNIVSCFWDNNYLYWLCLYMYNYMYMYSTLWSFILIHYKYGIMVCWLWYHLSSIINITIHVLYNIYYTYMWIILSIMTASNSYMCVYSYYCLLNYTDCYLIYNYYYYIIMWIIK